MMAKPDTFKLHTRVKKRVFTAVQAYLAPAQKD